MPLISLSFLDVYDVNQWALFITLHIIPYLQIGPISLSVCHWHAFPAYCYVTL